MEFFGDNLGMVVSCIVALVSVCTVLYANRALKLCMYICASVTLLLLSFNYVAVHSV